MSAARWELIVACLAAGWTWGSIVASNLNPRLGAPRTLRILNQVMATVAMIALQMLNFSGGVR